MWKFLTKNVLVPLGKIALTALILVGGCTGLIRAGHDHGDFADEDSPAVQELLEEFPGAGPFRILPDGRKGHAFTDTLQFRWQGWKCKAEINTLSTDVVEEPVCTAFGVTRTEPRFVGKDDVDSNKEVPLGKPQRKIGSHKGVNGLDAKERAAAILEGRDHARRAQEDGLGKVFAYSGR